MAKLVTQYTDVTMAPDGSTDHPDWQSLSVNMIFEHQYGHGEGLAPCHWHGLQ